MTRCPSVYRMRITEVFYMLVSFAMLITLRTSEMRGPVREPNRS